MAKYNIIRRDGESQEDFARRYGVERQRIHRAVAKGASPDVNCEVLVKAPRKGLDIPQEEWEALRQQPGESSEDWVRRNQKARHERYRKRDPEKMRARARVWAAAHPEYERARRKAYNATEASRASQARYCANNKEKRATSFRAWVAANPEKRAAIVRRWHDENPGLRAFYSAKWRKAARQATPPWADMEAIRAVYADARRISEETGIAHHVDHYYPLQGKTVCGLHVESNLRIITGAENVKKRNRMPD